MERDSLHHNQSQLPSLHELEMRLERMRRYMEATRPAFEEAARRSKALGLEPKGVLAGPSYCTKREMK